MVLLKSLNFTSAGIPKVEQFDAWRSFVGAAADITLEQPASAGFESTLDAWGLGGMAFLRASLPGAGYRRRYRKRKKDPVDHWCLLLTGEPHGASRLKMRPLARDFDHTSDDPRMLSLYISRDMFPGLADKFDALPTDLPSSGIHGLVADHLQSLARNLPDVRAGHEAEIIEITRALLAAMVTGSKDRTEEAEKATSYLLRERVRRFIAQNLASPELSPGTICANVGISRSNLYRMFDDVGGVAYFIKRQRLLKALESLSDVSSLAKSPSVNEIMEDLGFSDPSIFSRAFKAEFDFTPSEARHAALAGQPLLAPPSAGEPQDFNALLRSIRP